MSYDLVPIDISHSTLNSLESYHCSLSLSLDYLRLGYSIPWIHISHRLLCMSSFTPSPTKFVSIGCRPHSLDVPHPVFLQSTLYNLLNLYRTQAIKLSTWLHQVNVSELPQHHLSSPCLMVLQMSHNILFDLIELPSH